MAKVMPKHLAILIGDVFEGIYGHPSSGCGEQNVKK
jgi:hypothetical protein